MKTLLKETIVSIKKSFKRFLSILLIVLLGVGFFVGIKSTSPDMKETLNKYYGDTNFMDFNLISTWGINDDDISYLKKKGYIVEGSYSFDVIVKDEVEEAVKVVSYDENSSINKIVLVEGRLPQNEYECVVEYENFLKRNKISEKIIIESDSLINKKLTVVGMVKSPLYISNEMGSTKLLNGTLSYFIYVPINNFDIDYYTEANISLNAKYNYFSDDYDYLIKKETKKLEYYTNKLKDNRFNETKTKALAEYNDSLAKFDYEKEKSLNEINLYKTKLDDSKKEIEDNQKLLKEKFLEFNTKKNELNKTISELENNKELIKVNMQKLEESISNQESTKDSLNNLIDNNIDIENNIKMLESINVAIVALNDQKILLLNNINEIDNNILNIKTIIDDTEKELSSNQKLLDDSLIELNRNYTELNKNKENMYKEFYKTEIKLTDAKEDIDNLEKPTWYVLDRSTNTGAYQYNEDSNRIANVSKLFPLVFFIVAVLICLTSMTRMIEEERGNLGTLKSLGYTNNNIISKYIIYSLSATIIGSIIGIILGINIIPKVIYNMYAMMYNINDLVITFSFKFAFIGTISAVFCTLVATLLVAGRELRTSPAELLRPKAPKNGKRVLLERIKFIWNKLSFSRKVTIRNVFRYKKRFLMTIIGIMGCTGLIVAGFGLKDCIIDTVPSQYSNVFDYDIEVTLKDNISLDALNSAVEDIKIIDSVKDTVILNKESVTLDGIDTTHPIVLVVPFSDIDNFINIKNKDTNKKLELKDSVIVTEKIMKLLDLKVGDNITINSIKKYNVKIGNRTENYILHYIYMNQNMYDSDIYNTVLIKTNELNSSEEKMLANKLREISAVSNVSFVSNMENLFDSSMQNFSYVAWVLIVSAGLLAFIVLYNLASVNISERKRELATIKVLGFYDKETYNYVGRETTILTFIGILLGLGLGKLLTTFILKTCELDMLMFSMNINPLSYLYSALITIIFTMLVNITTYFALKKVDMIESLKSVE